MMDDPKREASVDTDKLEQQTGASLVTFLFGLMRALVLYEANNSAIGRVLDGLDEALTRYRAGGGGAVRIQLLAEECFVNGHLLKVDAGLYDKASQLQSSLQNFGMGEIAFSETCTRGHLETFATNLAASLRSAAVKLDPEAVPEVRLAPAVGRSIASFRFDPSQLALWLYASLLDLVDALYDRHAQGSPTSLLQVKRVLQLVVDGMNDHAGLYQLLATVRDPKVPMSKTRIRTVIAIETVGFTSWLGLRGSECLSLALAGLLGGLTEETDPDRAVEVLFRYPGLGDSALGLVLAVHDERCARLNRTAGLSGHVLASVGAFVEEAARADAGPPKEILQKLAERGVNRTVAELFAQYKGSFPVGSPVRLSDGKVGVVVGRGKDAPADRPIVAFGPGAPFDLASNPKIAIAEILPMRSGLDLSRPRS